MRAFAFGAGLLALGIAIGSPLAMLHEHLLSGHMAQHILLSLVAAPLILLGAPSRRTLAHPAICWSVGVCVFIGWHTPQLFQLGLRSHAWHAVEQASFFASGLIFWWPVIQPWSRTSTWPCWTVPLYLFAATLPCDGLSAFLAFSERVVYPAYLSTPRHFGVSALQDQEWAGALMWVCVTIVYAIPAAIVTTTLLSARAEDPAR